MPDLLPGKGFYLWQVLKAENGAPAEIARVAKEAGLGHVIVKVADAVRGYNITKTGVDLVKPVVAALRSVGISVWGFHYIYGYDPAREADRSIYEVERLGLDGLVINAEKEYRDAPARASNARTYMSRLRSGLPHTPLALSSYRYPKVHAAFPWTEFLEKCDINMPQVYWLLAHNPAYQLRRSIAEFRQISPWRPIVPTGAAWQEGSWAVTVQDINEFFTEAQALGLASLNFWEWGATRARLPLVWSAIRADSLGKGGAVLPPVPPTPEQQPAPSGALRMRVLQSGLRIRSKPDLSGAVLGELDADTTVHVSDVSGLDAWVYGQPDGKPAGWINARQGKDQNLEKAG